MEGVITIPDGVTKVGALFGGSEITGIIFPDSVTEISGTNYTTWDGPFAGCTKLESVTIPCNITQTYVSVSYPHLVCLAVRPSHWPILKTWK